MFKDDFLAYLRAGFPLLYVVTHEEQRALKDCADKKFKQFVWSGTDGLKSESGKISGAEDPTSLWNVIPSLEENSAIYLLDYHFFIESPDIIRKIKDMLPVMKAKGQHAVIVSCRTVLPPELEKDCVVLNFGLPQKDDLKKILNYVFQSANMKAESKNHDRVLEASLGMTANEAESVYSLALIRCGGKIDSPESVELIQKEKTAIIKKSGLLEFYDCKEDMGSVGGLDLLKAWLRKRQKGYSKEAREFGLSYPKGILLCGVPGTGKSLSAKAVAKEWGLPLLKFDLGKMFGSLVGQSEERIRQATALADAIGNCILWIEEIEKGLAGISSSGHTDSGVTARVFGTLLTWLNEKRGGAFVIATANDIGKIPAEFLRKGRWDDLFFVNLPTPLEREEILRIHLVKRKKEMSGGDIKDIAKALQNFSGAEIESLIEEAMFTAFDEGRELEKADLLRAAKETRTLFQTAPERVEAIRDWGKKYARPASTPHELMEEMEKFGEGNRKLDIS